MARIRRQFVHLQVTFAKATCESTIIDLREFDCLQVHMPAAWTHAALGLKVSPISNTTFKVLYAEQCCSLTVRVECSSAAASGVYTFPGAAKCSPFIKLWSQRAGVDQDQAAERILGASMKG